MDENEIIYFQSLVQLREQLVEDFRGDYTEMKDKVDEALLRIIEKNLKEEE